MKSLIARAAVIGLAFGLVVAACGDDDGGSTTTMAPVTTEGEHHDEGLELDAVFASPTVDGDASDWDAIGGLDIELKGIESESVESRQATVKVAYDDRYLYVLLTVDDDFDWNADDPHLSASPAVMFAVEEAAGPHMGTEAEGEEESYESLGLVDIWHWELECAMGEPTGGAVGDAGDGDPGNDGPCNFDDEYATDPESREDDNGDGAENSLFGVFGHTNPVAGGEGTWIFEMSRPLQTGDAQDAQFTAGGVAKMALAYWDADNGPDGWDDAEHVQSSYLGWIEVHLAS